MGMATPEAPALTSIPHSFISLTTKPNASLAYSFVPAKGAPSPYLITFLNGLGLPASSWHPTIALLTQSLSHPAILAYDRYGQGFTEDRDPQDASAEDPAFAHDCMAVVHDLHQLLRQIISLNHLDPTMGIFFVGNSLGCAVARLYAQTYPNSVSALVLLDSIMANSDMVSMYPDPDAPEFERKYLPLPEGVTEEGLREARGKMSRMFSPLHGVMGSSEGLSRRNLAELLPFSDRPPLTGVDGKGPWLSVVGHGFERFAEESLKGMGTPIAITNHCMNPYWNEYNLGLVKITSYGRSRGPVQAEKCGHFIQRDDPELVVHEIVELLERMSHNDPILSMNRP